MVKYCLICSAARSGSTLLDMLIGGHSAVASLGEFSFLGKAIALSEDCSCGVPVVKCFQWKKVFDRIQRERGINLLDTPYSLRQWDTLASVVMDQRQQTKNYLLWRKLRSGWCDLRYQLSDGSIFRLPLPACLGEGIENTFYLYNAVRNEWGKRVIVDSSKNVHKALAVYEKAPESTRIVFLTRDGRGVFFSRRGSGFSRKRSVKGWSKYNRRALTLLTTRVAKRDILHLKYEDLVSELKTTMMRICEFLNLKFESTMLDLSHGERHLVNGNDTRFNRGRGVIPDERWRKKLKGSELSYFMGKCSDLNDKLGYL